MKTAVLIFGPELDIWICRFVRRLEDTGCVRVVAMFCQKRVTARWRTWLRTLKRRGPIGVPILVARLLHQVRGWATGERQQVLRLANESSSRMHYAPDLHAESVLTAIRDLRPDIGLVYGGPILRPELFEIPRLGTLGIHHGKVPDYRGLKSTFWAARHQDATTGVTIQKINAGIDTGEVVASAEIPIDNQPLWRLRRNVYERGLELYVQAVLDVLAGAARPRPQGKGGGYYGNPTLKDYIAYGRVRIRRWFSKN